MCATFTEQLRNVTELTMYFNTSSLTTRQSCSCTIGAVDTCTNDWNWSIDDCVNINSLRPSFIIEDYQVLSCNRGYVTSQHMSLTEPRWYGYDIRRNYSSHGGYRGLAHLRNTIGQYSNFGEAHLAGQVLLKCKYL